MKLFNILLDPDQESGGGDPNPKPETTDNAAELEKLRQSVSKLEEVVRKERELKDEADRKARDLAQAAANANKTAEERFADQLRELSLSNETLRLEAGRERAVRDALSKIESEGYDVDKKALDGLLSVSHLSVDNVTAVVTTIVESLKRPKPNQVATANTNEPVAQKPEVKFGTMGDDALTAPWQGKQPDLKI